MYKGFRRCEMNFNIEEVLKFLQISGNSDLLNRLGALCAENGRELFYCANERCSAPFEFCGSDEVDCVDEDFFRVQCPECHEFTCVRCRALAHEGQSCSQYKAPKDDAQFIELVKKKGWNICPRCHHAVEKSYGCNHMTCRCRREFSYGQNVVRNDRQLKEILQKQSRTIEHNIEKAKKNAAKNQASSSSYSPGSDTSDDEAVFKLAQSVSSLHVSKRSLSPVNKPSHSPSQRAQSPSPARSSRGARHPPRRVSFSDTTTTFSFPGARATNNDEQIKRLLQRYIEGPNGIVSLVDWLGGVNNKQLSARMKVAVKENRCPYTKCKCKFDCIEDLEVHLCETEDHGVWLCCGRPFVSELTMGKHVCIRNSKV